jgi:hypothetical protein
MPMPWNAIGFADRGAACQSFVGARNTQYSGGITDA